MSTLILANIVNGNTIKANVESSGNIRVNAVTGSVKSVTAPDVVIKAFIKDQGPIGAKGDTGSKGDKGDQGIQGIQGTKGDKGDTGLTGAKGDQGIQGIQGEKGDKGDKGDAGTNGTNGTNGTDGDDAYVYIAYASDDTGTGFTLTFSALLDYIAVKNTTTAIASPVASDFTGLWKKYKGEQGTAGAGTGDVLGPASNTADYLPQWSGANSKTLKDGVAIPAGGLAGLTALGDKVDKVAGSRLITTAEGTILSNTSGTNSGDNATNTQYSGLASSKEDVANKENTTLDTSTTKYPTNRLTKEYADTKISKTTNITALNETGIADGEIVVFNLTNKDIRTSDKTIVTSLGADDTTVPTSKAVKDVTDGKISNSLVAAKGDIISASANDTPAVLPVGTDGYVLESRASETTGLRWVAPPSSSDLTMTSSPASDHTASGNKCVLNANENQAFGDVCFINADGQAQLGDADAIATSSCVAMCADATISANADGNYLLLGFARDDTWAWTVGGLIYLSTTGTTGNTLSQTAPTGTDDVVQIMGVATHADRMYFNPQLVQIELV